MDNKEIKGLNKVMRNGFNYTKEYHFYSVIYDIFVEHAEEYDCEFLIQHREQVLESLLDNDSLFWNIEKLVTPCIEDIISTK